MLVCIEIFNRFTGNKYTNDSINTSEKFIMVCLSLLTVKEPHNNYV